MTKTKLKESEKLRLPDCAGKRSWPRCLRCSGTSLMKTKNSFSKLWRSWILQPPEPMKIGRGILFRFFPINFYIRLFYCYCFKKLFFFISVESYSLVSEIKNQQLMECFPPLLCTNWGINININRQIFFLYKITQ